MARRFRLVSLAGSACLLNTWANAGVIYQNDFELQGPGPEWSGASLTTTPPGCTRCTSFLGEFGNQVVILQLASLPPHLSVALDFDLYVIRSWDGNLTQFGGPDIFRVVDGAENLNFQTTFSNNYPFGAQFNQAFPGAYPGGFFPSQSGAAEKQTLGYKFNANPIGVVPMDAVYHLSFSFTHSDASLFVFFSAENLSPLTDESWGLDNVVVSVSAVPEPASMILIGGGLVWLTIASFPGTVRWKRRSGPRSSRCLRTRPR
jgi:hypothetical protein